MPESTDHPQSLTDEERDEYGAIEMLGGWVFREERVAALLEQNDAMADQLQQLTAERDQLLAQQATTAPVRPVRDALGEPDLSKTTWRVEWKEIVASRHQEVLFNADSLKLALQIGHAVADEATADPEIKQTAWLVAHVAGPSRDWDGN